jgi:putative endonuclease
MFTDRRARLGESGEMLACRELERRGYAIVARRYRTRYGEIDIIAREGPVLVFVEVKTRRNTQFGGGVEAVTPFKQHRILAMARAYLTRYASHDQPCRFDVVSILWPERGAPLVEVYRGAFET